MDETAKERNLSAIDSRISHWCQNDACRFSGQAAVISGCGELDGGTTYVLDKNLESAASYQPDTFGCLVIKEPKVTIDCQGHTIRYTGKIASGGMDILGDGIRIYESDVTVRNCRIEQFGNGIAANAWGSKKHLVHLLFENNILFDNRADGLYLQGVEDSLFRNNVLSENQSGIYLVDGDAGVIVENNVACDNDVGAFRCVGALPEGTGNVFDEARLCENDMPAFTECGGEAF